MDRNPSPTEGTGGRQVPMPRVTRAQRHAQPAQSLGYPTVYPGRQPVRTAAPHPRPRQPEPDWDGRRYSTDKLRKNAHPFLYATIIMVCLVLLTGMGVLAAPQCLGVTWHDFPNYAFVNGAVLERDESVISAYKQNRAVLNADTFFPGATLDGVELGGMTLDQARAALSNETNQKSDGFSVTVNIGNKSWTIDSQRVPYTRNVETVLARAYALGRQNSTVILNTRVTPFEQRLANVQTLSAQPVSFTSEMTYDKPAVRSLTDSIASFVNRDPVDAQVKSFDFSTRSFTFTNESAGSHIDADSLYQQVITKLDSREYGSTITLIPEIITPKVTKVELMNSFKLVSTYTTETTNNSNRNTNIDLAAKAINGRTVMPGETFSFNAATGERTEAKGYKEAIAISGGQSVPDIGGGVCQASSTLFNAAARADLQIVDRSPHAWPSTYVEKGMDATVNWPGLDFKFKNNKTTPIFIIAWYKNRKVTVEIYGMSLGTGVTIDLASKVTKTLSAPTEVNYVQNSSLPAGTSEETIKARTGYVVDTYKVWYRDGQEIKRDKLFTSTYKAFQRTVEYN